MASGEVLIMCLGVPGRITDRWSADDGALLAHADFAGEVRVVRLNYLPDLAVGDYTIVHAGYALTRLDASQADEVLALLREVGLLEDGAADTTSAGRASQAERRRQSSGTTEQGESRCVSQFPAGS